LVGATRSSRFSLKSLWPAADVSNQPFSNEMNHGGWAIKMKVGMDPPRDYPEIVSPLLEPG
jgi:hypothetical protein